MPPRRGVVPRDGERPFGAHEIFFSTTDRKGVIRSGNRVFQRVAAYSEEELVGAPHNIIRHPDMPRVVFQLLWQEIEAGRRIAAYVKNMAADGCYYWVLATVMPVEDGYLSVRVKPTCGLLPTVAALYEELRAVERGVEEGGGTPRQAMAASGPLLMEQLAGLGFGDYEAFMRTVLPLEMRNVLEARGAGSERGEAGSTGLRTALRACNELRCMLAREFAQLDRYEEMEAAFAGKSDSVLALADDIRLFSLNAQIGSARLQQAGAALGVIADIMRVRSDAVAGSVRGMSEAIEGAKAALGTLAFEVSFAALQCEMVHQFMGEVEAGEARLDALLAANVTACLESGLSPLGGRLESVQRYLDDIGRGVELMRDELGRLEMLQVAGRVETARLAEAAEFAALFHEIRTQVETAKQELAGLAVVDQLRAARDRGATGEVIGRNVAQIVEWARAAGVERVAA